MDSSNFYYGCTLEESKNKKDTRWNCELFDSFEQARDYVRLRNVLEQNSIGVGRVVDVSRVWPGFVRRELLYFKLATAFSIGN